MIPKLSNEIKVGLLALGAFLVLILGYSFLKGSDLFSNTTHLYSTYANVDGLTDSKPILINGFKVGKVGGMVLLPNGEIVVRLDISKGFKIPKNTIAKLDNVDLLGTKAIVLLLGTSKELASNEDTLESQNRKSLAQSLAPLQNQTQQLITRIDTFLNAVNSIINPKFQRNVDKSMSSIAGSLQNLEIASKQINKSVPVLTATFKNIEDFTKNLSDNNRNISASITNVKTITDQLAGSNLEQSLQELNASIKNFQGILSKVNNGNGSLSSLINDKELYTNLTASTANLNRLMIDLKANPKRYVSFSVFGGGRDKKSTTSPPPAVVLPKTTPAGSVNP